MKIPNVELPIGKLVRQAEPFDLPALKAMIDGADLFPSEMLDDMIAGFFAGTASNEYWLTIDDGELKALAYYAAERMTEGTWNLLLITVHPDHQRQGYGTAMMCAVEHELSKRGERLLLIETSSLPAFERARIFYEKLGYDREAKIRDFYSDGDDKIVFRKAL